jgi:hypothetical protein
VTLTAITNPGASSCSYHLSLGHVISDAKCRTICVLYARAHRHPGQRADCLDHDTKSEAEERVYALEENHASRNVDGCPLQRLWRRSPAGIRRVVSQPLTWKAVIEKTRGKLRRPNARNAAVRNSTHFSQTLNMLSTDAIVSIPVTKHTPQVPARSCIWQRIPGYLRQTLGYAEPVTGSVCTLRS